MECDSKTFGSQCTANPIGCPVHPTSASNLHGLSVNHLSSYKDFCHSCHSRHIYIIIYTMDFWTMFACLRVRALKYSFRFYIL